MSFRTCVVGVLCCLACGNSKGGVLADSGVGGDDGVVVETCPATVPRTIDIPAGFAVDNSGDVVGFSVGVPI